MRPCSGTKRANITGFGMPKPNTIKQRIDFLPPEAFSGGGIFVKYWRNSTISGNGYILWLRQGQLWCIIHNRMNMYSYRELFFYDNI